MRHFECQNICKMSPHTKSGGNRRMQGSRSLLRNDVECRIKYLNTYMDYVIDTKYKNESELIEQFGHNFYYYIRNY